MVINPMCCCVDEVSGNPPAGPEQLDPGRVQLITADTPPHLSQRTLLFITPPHLPAQKDPLSRGLEALSLDPQQVDSPVRTGRSGANIHTSGSVDLLPAAVDHIQIAAGLPPDQKITFLSLLKEGRGFRPADVLEAVQLSPDYPSALRFLTHCCPLCQEQIISMTHCSCFLCESCFKAFFSSAIKEKSIDQLTCPQCGRPEVRGQGGGMEYFNLLDTQIRHFLPPQTHELGLLNIRVCPVSSSESGSIRTSQTSRTRTPPCWSVQAAAVCSVSPEEAVFTSPAPSVSTSSVEAADRPSAQERCVYDAVFRCVYDAVFRCVYDAVFRCVYDAVFRYVYDAVFRCVYDAVLRCVYDAVFRCVYDAVFRCVYDAVFRVDAVFRCVYDAVFRCVYDGVFRCVYDAVLRCVYDAVFRCVYAAVLRCVYDAVFRCVYDAVLRCVYDAVFRCVYAAVVRCVYDAVFRCVYDAVFRCVYDAVFRCVYAAVVRCVYDAVLRCVYDAVFRCVYDAVFRCVYDAVFRCVYDAVFRYVYDAVFRCVCMMLCSGVCMMLCSGVCPVMEVREEREEACGRAAPPSTEDTAMLFSVAEMGAELQRWGVPCRPGELRRRSQSTQNASVRSVTHTLNTHSLTTPR
ncbi:hypothetical protein F7725_010757 [Dissostichus mawsoni]|uniref:Uncharacterized protein n=1 Tax=Dissostichus mawsoni TaxID=36200 RepID=A0A7J5Z7C7_DISMA|nr:hypothetical protein F7725_010757 [Dissostichus mawsoni]